MPTPAQTTPRSYHALLKPRPAQTMPHPAETPALVKLLPRSNPCSAQTPSAHKRHCYTKASFQGKKTTNNKQNNNKKQTQEMQIPHIGTWVQVSAGHCLEAPRPPPGMDSLLAYAQ